jgi:nicotinamide-nucleotide amidase
VPIAELLSQGDEVVTGQIADTNAAWLSQQLTDLGFTVLRHTTVGDRLDDLVAVFREIGARADVCLCTGGLGPTDDDLTAEAVARAFDRPLQLDEVALGQIEERFRSFGRAMATRR